MKEEQERLLKYIGDLYEKRRVEKKSGTHVENSEPDHDHIVLAGKKIRKAREKKKMTVEELAALTDLLPSYISEIEFGEADPYMTEIQSISKALDVELSYLFEKK